HGSLAQLAVEGRGGFGSKTLAMTPRYSHLPPHTRRRPSPWSLRPSRPDRLEPAARHPSAPLRDRSATLPARGERAATPRTECHRVGEWRRGESNPRPKGQTGVSASAQEGSVPSSGGESVDASPRCLGLCDRGA